jgi:hypothetical protein
VGRCLSFRQARAGSAAQPEMKSPAEAGLVGGCNLSKIVWYWNALLFREFQQALDTARSEQKFQR